MLQALRFWLWERRATRHLREQGWTMVTVRPPPPAPPWAYTLGLPESFDCPELIGFSTSVTDAAKLVDFVREGVQEQRLSLRDGLRWRFGEGERDEVCLRQVDESQYLGFGWFALAKEYRHRRTGRRQLVRAFQVFLPDFSCRYPWEHGCDELSRAMQPRLYLPMDPELPFGGAFADTTHPSDLDLDLQLAQQLERIDRGIRTRGWSVVCVGSYAEGMFAYTVGLTETLGEPELIVFDVPCSEANALVEDVYGGLKEKALLLEDGKRWPSGDPGAGMWRRVDASHIKGDSEWLTLALHRHRQTTGSTQGLKVFQYVLCDTAQKFPWEQGYDASIRHLQAPLWEPRAEDPQP